MPLISFRAIPTLAVGAKQKAVMVMRAAGNIPQGWQQRFLSRLLCLVQYKLVSLYVSISIVHAQLETKGIDSARGCLLAGVSQ